MENIEKYLHDSGDCFYLKVKVVPNSSKQEIFDVLADNTIKIRLRSAPEK